MGDILTSDDYDMVRAAIEVTLDADDLPDHVIAMDIYLGQAELDIKSKVENWSSLVGDELVRLRNATVYQTALLLVDAVRLPLSKKVDDVTFRWSDRDDDELKNKLRGRVDDELDELLDPAYSEANLLIFDIASGQRGR